MATTERRTAAYRAAVSARNLRVVSADCDERADIGPGGPVINRNFNHSAVIVRLNVEAVDEIQGRLICDWYFVRERQNFVADSDRSGRESSIRVIGGGNARPVWIITVQRRGSPERIQGTKIVVEFDY